MEGRLQPEKELRIEFMRINPEPRRRLVVISLQSANIREIRGKDCFRGGVEWILIFRLQKVDFFRWWRRYI
jgi:hypothetical protein